VLVVDYAICLLARASLVGIVRFLLPPTGERPPYWQIGLAFLGLVAWCYQRGLLGRRAIFAAAIEAVPMLWLSLLWTQLFVNGSAMIWFN
jgi:hypothetical protein